MGFGNTFWRASLTGNGDFPPTNLRVVRGALTNFLGFKGAYPALLRKILFWANIACTLGFWTTGELHLLNIVGNFSFDWMGLATGLGDYSQTVLRSDSSFGIFDRATGDL